MTGVERLTPLVDTHAHVMDRAFDGDRGAVLERAVEAGVSRMVCVGYDLPGSRAAVALAREHPEHLRATVGIHPNSAGEGQADASAYAEIERLSTSPEVVGVGETGLDNYRHHTPAERQRWSLEWHLALAEARHLPVVIHNREADTDIAPLLERSAGRRSAGELPGVLHCFSSLDARFLAHMLEAGYYVSLAGTLTYRSAEGLRALVASVPLDRLLVETDCPYLAPVPERGKRNEPAFVTHTARQLAEVVGVSLPTLQRHLWENALRLFPTLDPANRPASLEVKA